MDASAWTRVRRELERLRDRAPREREEALRALDDAGAGTADMLRELLAADAAGDALLDADPERADEEQPDPPARGAARAWIAALDPRALLGAVVEGFRVVEVLGEGGSATVYRAVRAGGPMSGVGAGEAAEVALKVLKPEACRPGILRRFEQERAALAGLEHPGLVRVLGAGRLADGRPYLRTGLVDGRPLDEHCERAGLPLAARVRLCAQVARAVHHAHRHLVVHRDLKPSNILVGADGLPVVLDFGVAKLLDPERDPRFTEHFGRGPLTLAFASPEQARGEPVTTASDVYSLGVVLHLLATGAGPYAAAPDDGSEAGRAELERAVAEGRRLSAQAVAREHGRPPLPRDLVLILERALARAPAQRYASAEHLAQDLECLLERRPLASRSEPWPRRVAALARRRPWATAGALAVLALLAGSWIATARGWRRVAAGERIAWQAHASAVEATRLLADLVERVGASSLAPAELEALLAGAERTLAEPGIHGEAEARARMALARLERRRPGSAGAAAAEAHWTRALELSRATRGLSWRDTEACLQGLLELRAERGDPRALEPARERAGLLAERGDVEGARAARRTLEELERRFAGATGAAPASGDPAARPRPAGEPESGEEDGSGERTGSDARPGSGEQGEDGEEAGSGWDAGPGETAASDEKAGSDGEADAGEEAGSAEGAGSGAKSGSAAEVGSGERVGSGENALRAGTGGSGG